jgi:VanZ family protein
MSLVVVIVGELLPGDSAPMVLLSSTNISDKVFHFVAYMGLAFLPMLGFRPLAGIACAGSMILLGIALEFAQTLVPGRSYEVADMVANTLGVCTGIAAGLLGRRLLNRQRQSA